MDFEDVENGLKKAEQAAATSYSQVRARYKPWWLYLVLAILAVAVFFWMKWAVEGWAQDRADAVYAQKNADFMAKQAADQVKIDAQQQIIDHLKTDINDLRTVSRQQDTDIADTRRLIEAQTQRTRASGAALGAVRAGTFKRLGSDTERQRELEQLYQK